MWCSVSEPRKTCVGDAVSVCSSWASCFLSIPSFWCMFKCRIFDVAKLGVQTHPPRENSCHFLIVGVRNALLLSSGAYLRAYKRFREGGPRRSVGGVWMSISAFCCYVFTPYSRGSMSLQQLWCAHVCLTKLTNVCLTCVVGTRSSQRGLNGLFGLLLWLFDCFIYNFLWILHSS